MTVRFASQGTGGHPPDGAPGRARRWRTPRAVLALMLREIATTYGRSPGGYLWAILEPVGAIALLSFGFSLIFRAPSLGANFPLFYATAYLPFMLYAVIAANLMSSLRFSRQLLAYPAITYLDALLARFALALITQLLVCALVLGGIVVIFDTRSILTPGDILLSLSMAAALGFGVGVLNCVLVSISPLWGNVWSIVNRPLFLVSGVLFLLEDLPRDLARILWYNPLMHVTGRMRSGFYATYDAAYVSPAYVFALALSAGVLGLLLLGRYHRQILSQNA